MNNLYPTLRNLRPRQIEVIFADNYHPNPGGNTGKKGIAMMRKVVGSKAEEILPHKIEVLFPRVFFLLFSRRLPAQLTVEDVAVLLGTHRDGIPILIRAGLLKPLGDPAPNSQKLFAAESIEEKMSDVEWLDEMSRVLSNHWKKKNALASEKVGKFPTDEAAPPDCGECS